MMPCTKAPRTYLTGAYSPECVEGDSANFALPEFSELRLDGVRRSTLRKDLLQLYLLSREPFTLWQGRYLPSS
jgi:hypothetical protein